MELQLWRDHPRKWAAGLTAPQPGAGRGSQATNCPRMEVRIEVVGSMPNAPPPTRRSWGLVMELGRFHGAGAVSWIWGVVMDSRSCLGAEPATAAVNLAFYQNGLIAIPIPGALPSGYGAATASLKLEARRDMSGGGLG
ncbi:MAG: hypothetical protein KatS3mg111_1354 [Pirellulaceae bacterium]|nr:MAG: hypothetical protein KatS3mg111_1354 [Pirellulaceae bacterium]